MALAFATVSFIKVIIVCRFIQPSMRGGGY